VSDDDPPDRPNVVCIVADDLGWRDLGCQGSPFYETPRIDRLAREGTRFTDAYASCPVCSPTRASLMTGRYPASVGITNYIPGEARGKLVEPDYEHALPAEETTLATALDGAGYATWHVGKWHLGGADRDSLPTDHGFGTNVAGCEWGMPSNGYFSPWEIPTLEDPERDGQYLPDRLAGAAVDLIEDHDGDRPFFLNYCPYLVHTPLQAPDPAVQRYRRKRASLGLNDSDAPGTEVEIGGRFPTEHKRDGRIRRRRIQGHPTYAAMVEALDRCVGRVVDALERTGRLEETVIVFTSDNGGLATAEGSPTTNRPLAEGKGWMQEGGNRVPLLVRWPGVTDGPALCETPVTTPDLYPTLLDAAGVPVPDQPVEGTGLRPALAGDGLDREAIFWHYPHYGNQGGTPAAAVRTDGWKLIEFYEDGGLELYHLETDLRERRDLAAHRPEMRDALHERLREWRASVDARLPDPDPEFDPWPERAGR